MPNWNLIRVILDVFDKILHIIIGKVAASGEDQADD